MKSPGATLVWCKIISHVFKALSYLWVSFTSETKSSNETRQQPLFWSFLTSRSWHGHPEICALRYSQYTRTHHRSRRPRLDSSLGNRSRPLERKRKTNQILPARLSETSLQTFELITLPHPPSFLGKDLVGGDGPQSLEHLRDLLFSGLGHYYNWLHSGIG